MNHAQYSTDRAEFHDSTQIDNLYAFELDGGCDAHVDALDHEDSFPSNNSHHGQPYPPYPTWAARSYAFSSPKETDDFISDYTIRGKPCYSIGPERSEPKTFPAETRPRIDFHEGSGLAGGSTDSTVYSYEKLRTATSSIADVDHPWSTTSFNEDLDCLLDLQNISAPSPHEHSANCPNPHRSSAMLSLTDISRHPSSMTVEYYQGTPTGDDSSTSSWMPASKELARTSSPSSISATTSSTSKASSLVSDSLQALHCDQCNTPFTGRFREGNLARHKRHRHGQKYHPCLDPLCNKVYKRSDALRKHCIKSHPQFALLDQPHAFPATFESHPTPSQGLDVTNTDTATEQQDLQPNYSCPEPGCALVFERNAELIRHSRTHLSESERPYRCTQCDQSFLYPKDLRRHETTHSETNSGSIHCHVNSCSYGPGGLSFTRRDGLLRHMRRTHPDLD
jgi:uncharacterized Zn-finger protein